MTKKTSKQSTASTASVTTRKQAKENNKAVEVKQAKPKAMVSSIQKRMKALPPKGLTPIWMQYYEQEAKDPDTDYGRGYNKPPDFYERLMETYVSCNDTFFDTLQQNPESCAIVYPDGSGAMKILHHLTAENHGKPIIVGLEGFGNMSEVKAIHEELLVDRASVDDKSSKLPIRSGAAMALFMTKTSPDRIMLLGRWKSLAFMAYIRPQVIEWSITLASSMIEFDHFLDLKPTHLPSSATHLHHHHGRPITIEKFNVDFG